ncbi:protein of unknown function (4846) [Proteiniborus ethanoligenes]|uniref:Lipoprotein n=1 Tax=Proteiniborus ethanoligenes TaxID=415015 RepID=A0A1H3Q3B9_9FIRM|nr:DUF4846 domain-containing protein [Proteiniborus ethanoligenes]SDZ07877.1 protein of unknown function (4846) [Proteiniborus ethanoligenes]
MNRMAVIFLLVILSLTGCATDKNSIELSESINRPSESKVVKNTSHIISDGITIETRYLPPEGYTKVEVVKGSFEEFLRNQRLKPYGEKALYYDGREKSPKGIYDSVIDVDIGHRDLHQCADAIMLLRGEYLYSIGAYAKINFNFVSGFKAEYNKWMEGYRIKVEGNNVSYYKATEPSNTYEDFRKFMDMVFAYSGTLSLEKELESVHIDDMKIGDVFIVGGSPGHAVVVMDMAVNQNNEKIFILAQSYMPAQQTQILINPNEENMSPWYSLKDCEKLITPEWIFELNQLKRF